MAATIPFATMPTSLRKGRYMSPAQLQWFRQRLEHEIASATARVERLTSEEASAVLLEVGDETDRASAEEAAATRNSEIRSLVALQAKCRAAIERIEVGEFGFCGQTGEPIGIDRLLALPHAHLCVAAAQRNERTQSLYRRAA